MAMYQVLCIENGRIIERTEIDADSDDEALALLSLGREKTDCELWCGKRKVASIARGANARFVEADGGLRPPFLAASSNNAGLGGPN
jgi:hypothetical protein